MPSESALSPNLGQAIGILAAVTNAGEAFEQLALTEHAPESTVSDNERSFLVADRGEPLGILAGITRIGSQPFIQLTVTANAPTVDIEASESAWSHILPHRGEPLGILAALTQLGNGTYIELAVTANPTTNEVQEDTTHASNVPTAVLYLVEHVPTSGITEPVTVSAGGYDAPQAVRKPRRAPTKAKVPTDKLKAEALPLTAQITGNIRSTLDEATRQVTRIGVTAEVDYDEDRMMEEAEILLTILRWREAHESHFLEYR